MSTVEIFGKIYDKKLLAGAAMVAISIEQPEEWQKAEGCIEGNYCAYTLRDRVYYKVMEPAANAPRNNIKLISNVSLKNCLYTPPAPFVPAPQQSRYEPNRYGYGYGSRNNNGDHNNSRPMRNPMQGLSDIDRQNLRIDESRSEEPYRSSHGHRSRDDYDYPRNRG